MAWIESHQDLARHPKLLQFAASLEVSENEAIGIIHKLWWWALDYAEDGDIGKYPLGAISMACGYHDPDRFMDALISAGFVDVVGEHTLIHDWWDYAGKFFRARYGRKKSSLQRLREHMRDLYSSETEEFPQGQPDKDPDPDPKQEPEQEPEPEQKEPKQQEQPKPATETKPKSTRFVKPTLSEVTAYCTERKNGIDPQQFLDYYESKGWMIGKNKMKNWKAAIRTWENRRQDQNGGKGGRLAALRQQEREQDTQIQSY